MQSKSTTASQNLSSASSPKHPISTTQHGLGHDEHQPVAALSHERENKGHRPSSVNIIAEQDAAPLSDRKFSDTERAASLTSRTSSPQNEVNRHERAVSFTDQPRSPPFALQIRESIRSADVQRCTLTQLPNEILTHALSHLSPNDLASVSLVSKRFHNLVTTPHAWREAFNRYFPGPSSLGGEHDIKSPGTVNDIVRSDKRSFTRLTALASWRSEYILRTRLLRSLARGKPVSVPSSAAVRSGQSQLNTSTVTYNTQTFASVNHLHVDFESGFSRRPSRLIHGADDVGIVTTSEPTTGKVDSWGLSDPNFYPQFAERFPGMPEWGLGSGEFVGRPNVMDVSQPYGVIYGQGCPEGSCYHRALDEQRGRSIAEPLDLGMPELGIPRLGIDGGAICSVWIAKSRILPSLSEGLIGLMMGSAAGVVSACSLGTDGLRGLRLQRGEVTARWVLSPGVPIVQLAVDDNYSLKRQAQNRVWAVALNALGELFFLTKIPTRPQAHHAKVDEHGERLAWLTGRSVYWNFVEPSRRMARPDPYNDNSTDGSYSPRTSWDGMCLSKDQICAETKEIERFMRKMPIDFRKTCQGWDMRRRLEVDFAADNGNYAGESMIVFQCGLDEGTVASIRRYSRSKTRSYDGVGNAIDILGSLTASSTSLFGAACAPHAIYEGANDDRRTRSSSHASMDSGNSPERDQMVEEWRCSDFALGGLVSVQISTTALDNSTYATLTLSEDPIAGLFTTSTSPSPFASPSSAASHPGAPADIPGQRGRFVAAGTCSGVVLVWDARSHGPRVAEFPNNVPPIRIICTESPEISCVALTALYLVVGGNDGLVQAWDPLAAVAKPVRTIHSRFASRARRRLVQAQASAQGVGINMFAAGAVMLDPDPTVLRGVVALGHDIRYWSYGASAADQYKSSKRRLRRSERGSNAANDRLIGTVRANINNYIANEKHELECEKQERQRHADRINGRFGTDLLDNDEEALAYATMLSQESQSIDTARHRKKLRKEPSITVNDDLIENGQAALSLGLDQSNVDADMAEAIRLSLEDEFTSASQAPDGTQAFDAQSIAAGSSTIDGGLSDLEFAMRLSLAEERSRVEMREDHFPPLSSARIKAGRKGKGRPI